MPAARLMLGSLPDLEDALVEAAREAAPGDPLAPGTVLVGHVLLRPYLRRLLAMRGVSRLNLRFLRPNELAEDLADGAGGSPQSRLTREAERLIVRSVASQASGYFARIAGRDGFAEALGRLFRELDLGDFTPVSLARAISEGGSADDAKLGELSRLYGIFRQSVVEAKFASAGDLCRVADVSRFSGPLFVYGLWSPPALHAQLIERIATTNDVTIFLPTSGIAVEDDAHSAFVERLAGAGARRHVIEGGTVHDAGGRIPVAAFPDVAAGATLTSAPDPVREVWEAARTCLAWAREGIPFHEMAVVYRHQEPYRGIIDEIFREAGIEVYLHDGRPLASHPLGRQLLRLLDLAAAGTFARREVMEFLTATRLPPETSEAYELVRPSEWETYTREAGIAAGAGQWDERLKRLAAEKREGAKMEGREWLAEAADRVGVLRRFAADFAAALAERPDEASWQEHLEYLGRLTRRYAADAGPLIEALADLRALRAVASRVTFDVFCRTVRDYLETRDISGVLGGPPRLFGREGVAALDAKSMRHLRFEAVHLVGVAGRSWPPPPRPDPLLLEHERAGINAAAGAAALPMRMSPDDEPLTFRLAALGARSRLAISYARADAAGAGKHLPSHFFQAVAEAKAGHRLSPDEVESPQLVRRVAAGRLGTTDIAESLTEAEWDRSVVLAAPATGTAGVAISALAQRSPAFADAVEARDRRWGAALTPYDGCLEGAESLSLARQRSPFGFGGSISPSRLETYVTCPYRFFMRYALHIEPVEDPETIERVSPLERGSLIHEILERFLSELEPDDPPRSAARERHLPRLLEVATEEARLREERGITGRPLIWEMDRQQILEDLVGWYDAEAHEGERSGMRPAAFEVRFGRAGYGLGTEDASLSSDEPLILRVGDRTVRLHGRIDRIDLNDGRSSFRVIDYKTGATRLKARAVFDAGRALQLPVYLLAAAQVLGLEPANGEAHYFYISSAGGFVRRMIDGDLLASHRDEFEQIIASVADGVDGGTFLPNPGKGKHNCMFCDYKDVCDVAIDRIMAKKRDDPRGATYVGLETIA